MHKAYIIISSFLLFFPLVAQSADIQTTKEEKKEKARLVAKDEFSIIRQKNVLHRVIDDLDKSISYMEEDIDNFESRIDSLTLLEPIGRVTDLFSMKDAYERHLKWLYKMNEAFKIDFESYSIFHLNVYPV